MNHISDIKKLERCETFYWLSKHEPKEYFPFANYTHHMTDFVKAYFMIQDAFEGQVGDDGNQAMDALNTKDILLNARFEKDGLRIKVPLMIKGEHGWIVYFTYSLCYPKESDAQRIADHIVVLEACGIIIENIYAIHLHAEYVRHGDLDVRKLLVVNACLFNQKNHANHTILELIAPLKRDVFQFIPRLHSLDESNHVGSVRTKACTRGGKCAYYEDCFPNEDTTTIHHLIGAKLDLMEQGIQEIKEVSFDQLEGTRQQYAQYMAAKTDALYMDRFAVQNWVDHKIVYPILYLDFEWETFAYPPYEGMRPYDVLTFQYSLHVEKQHDASLQHYEFLAEGDCREQFINQLLHDIPNTGSILVYNMEGAEKLRLKQLADQFPQYRNQLDALCERMVDLSLPFATGNIYDNRMEGFFSLKKLVSIFSNHDYHDLAISHGMDAVKAWRRMATLEGNEKAAIRDQLLAYCAMDTYGEVLVYHKIIEMLGDTLCKN